MYLARSDVLGNLQSTLSEVIWKVMWQFYRLYCGKCWKIIPVSFSSYFCRWKRCEGRT